MPDAAELFAAGNGSVVAPAGHGKTELIAKVAKLGRRALILTHTTAGVDALRSRLKRIGVHHSAVAVDTIAGWCMRYAYAFPGVASPPADMPKTTGEWERLYTGAARALGVPAVREVVEASYDKILIDEYQDCSAVQHALAVALSDVVPTMIFGDALQGIFEFDRASLNWPAEIHPRFPLIGELETPHRWANKNPGLGEWVLETRRKLLVGAEIDLTDPRIAYRNSGDAFDMGLLFEGMDTKEGTFAAIHCDKGLCYRIAKASNGGYQAIEENAAKALREFASDWDRARTGDGRRDAIFALRASCFNARARAPGADIDPAEAALEVELAAVVASLASGDGSEGAARYMSLAQKHPRWKLYRRELWRDAERTAREVASERHATMSGAANSVRQRAAAMGRRLPQKTVSTPLLLKGLEFDHVVIPDASHFAKQSKSQARLFYVAISRATRSLVIASSEPVLQFPVPNA